MRYLSSFGKDVRGIDRHEYWSELGNSRGVSGRRGPFVFAAGNVEHPETPEEKEKYLENYKKLLDRALEIAVARNCTRFIYLSSGDVYGSSDGHLFRESDTLSPENVYGLSRMLGEQRVKEWSQEYSLETLVVRPFLISGPNQKNRFLSDLVRRLSQGGDFKVKNPGLFRDFLALSDFLRLVALTLEHTQRELHSVANACSAFPRNLGELAQVAQKLLGGSVVEGCPEELSQGGTHRVGSNDLARELFGWTPKIVSLESLILEVRGTSGYKT